MTTEKIFDEALKNILSEDEILKDEPMKHHTTKEKLDAILDPKHMLDPMDVIK